MILIKGIPFRKINGITLFPFIIVRPKSPSQVLINHEKIHIYQQLELLVLPFYIWYVLEWSFHYLKYRDWWKAYRQISFEREAYENELNLNYLKTRKWCAFWFYFGNN